MNALTFAARLTRIQAGTLFSGYVKRDPMARLKLREGRNSPYGIYEQLRAQGPLVRTARGNWVTTCYHMCSAILQDPRFGVRPSRSELDNRSLLGMNPPDHTRLRKLIQPSFTPRVIRGYELMIERTCDELLSKVQDERFDLVSAYSTPLPVAVISEILGIPDADSAEFAHHGVVLGSSLDGIRSVRHARQLQRSSRFMRELFELLIAKRVNDPHDDLISRLSQSNEITPQETMFLCRLLLIAGFETTVNLISNTVLALLAHPDEWRLVSENPPLADMAVKETLRWDGSIQRVGRVALEDVALEGQVIRKGEAIGLLLGAANRDPYVYANPGKFDVLRGEGPEHLTFSFGSIHNCIGRPLALLEAGIAVGVLAERMPLLEIAGKVRRRNATIVRGPRVLPVRG